MLAGKSSHNGAIIGGIVGGVAFLFLVGLLTFLLVRRSRKTKPRRGNFVKSSIYQTRSVMIFCVIFQWKYKLCQIFLLFAMKFSYYRVIKLSKLTHVKCFFHENTAQCYAPIVLCCISMFTFITSGCQTYYWYKLNFFLAIPLLWNLLNDNGLRSSVSTLMHKNRKLVFFYITNTFK